MPAARDDLAPRPRRRQRLRRRRIVAGSAAILLILAGAVTAVALGGGSTEQSVKTKKRPPATTTTTAPAPTAPLTGLPDATSASRGRPALSVKIENTPDARPQTGIDVADVVYEQVTEGGITRFIAIFNSTVPDVIGPIRSVRAMDPDVVWPLGGIFATSGGIALSEDAIRAAPVNTLIDDGTGHPMYRDRTKRAPHNLFAHAADLFAKGGTPMPPPRLFSYLPTGASFPGDPAQSVTIGFDRPYAPTYTFDAASRSWKRSIGFAPFLAADSQQVAPTNVIVQFVTCCLASPEGGAYQTVGSGAAWVFSDGKVVKGLWSRSDHSQVTQFTDAAGHPLQLLPGRTWVEFVPAPSGPAVTIVAPPPTAPPATAPATPPTTRY